MARLSETIFSLLPAAELNKLSVERTWRHIPGGFPNVWNVLSWGWIEDFIHRESRNHRLFRFFINGKSIDPGRFSLIDKKGRLNVDALRPLLPQGITGIFNRLESSSGDFWDDAVQFERALGAVVSIDAIASLSAVCGLPAHYDAQDLIIIQIDGRKTWKMLGTPIDGPWIQRDIHEPGAVTGEVVMHPGDVMFVPAGLCHQCTPLDPSLHLGVLIRRPCGFELLDTIKTGWSGEAALGNRLSLDEGEGDRKQQEEQLKETLQRLVQEMDVSALIRAWLAERQRPARQGVLGPKGGGSSG